MDSVHAATSPAPPPPAFSSHGGAGITAEDLKRVDISRLSQSELQALSLCSDSAFDLCRTDDVVCPKLDRSVFNESAGSRRQTYSRLHHRSHSRLPGLHPSFKPHRLPNSSSDHVSHSIVHFLRHFLSGNKNPPPPPPTPPSPPPQEESKAVVNPNVDLGFLRLQDKLKVKRKRARKSKNLNKTKLLESGAGVELQRVNCKGEVVDLAQLEKIGDELYNEELKRRTMGLETEDGVLGFLWSLEGQWCSRRKKRKYVDAALFGDALPIGWKLLLGLRRRDFRVSVYCRRYISPSGQQFLSSKEAAFFLKSYFKNSVADQNMDQKTSSIQQNSRPVDKADDVAPDALGHLTTVKCSSSAHDDMKSIENLPEVRVQDIFECVLCNLTFDEKDVFLQHLVSSHQKTSKTDKFGEPVGEGVIVKDGKYECQFCQEVFLERHSYNGHVASHVRVSGKDSNELTSPGNLEKNPEPPLPEEIPLRSSKMDALIEIAQNSIFESSTIDTGEHVITSHTDSVRSLEEPCKEDVGAERASNLAEASNDEANLCLDPVKPQKEDPSADGALGESLNHGREVMTVDNDMVGNDYAWDMNVKMDTSCMNDSEPTGMGEMVEYESSMVMGFENRCLEQNDDDHPDVFHDGISSVPLAQPFEFFPPFDSVPNKGENEFSVSDQKLEGVTGFEELGFDLEPFRYSFVNEQELPSLPGGSLDLRNDSAIDDGFNSAVRFGSEVMLDGSQLTVCVWCRTEFKLEGIDSETASDSIGYMCPTCKSKISGHFTHGLSLDPRNL